MKASTLRLCAALFLAGAAPTLAHAQVITDYYVERGLRYGVRSFEGEPYTQRYSYGLTNSNFYINGNSRELYYLDYLDRADRARKFGYRMPADPFFPPTPEEVAQGVPVGEPIMPPPPAVHPGRTGFFGGGLGWFRRH